MGDVIWKSRNRHPLLGAIIVALSAVVIAAPGEAVNPLGQASAESSVQEYKDLPLLEPGKPFDSQLSSGQTRSFRISLGPGQCLRMIVDHWGIDIDVTWYGPGGQKITGIGCRRSEPTPVTLVTEASGTYRLELRGRDKYPAQGRCQVTAGELRVATARDKKCMLAEQAAAEAERLRWEWKEVLSRRAIKKYEEALAFWRSAGESREESVALRCIGEVYHGLGRSRDALTYFHQALQIIKASRGLRGEGEILNDLGSVY